MWLALAVLWAAGALLLTGLAFLNPYVYTETHAYIFGLTSFPPKEVDKISDEAVAALTAANRGQMIHRTAEIGPYSNIAMFFTTDTALPDIEFAENYLVERLKRERSGEVERARWANLGTGLFWTAFPPLALLGLGAVLGWIFSGFRKVERAR